MIKNKTDSSKEIKNKSNDLINQNSELFFNENLLIATACRFPTNRALILENLQPNDFFYIEHQHAFKLMQELYYTNKNFDFLEFAAKLIETKVYKVSNATDICEVAKAFFASKPEDPEIIKDLVKKIKNYSGCRLLYNLGKDMQNEIINKDFYLTDPEGVKDWVSNQISKIDSDYFSESDDEIHFCRQTMTDCLNMVEHHCDLYKEDPRWIDKSLPHFGFKTLDDIAPLAFKPGSLVILGGRPASGKTSFLMNVLENMAAQGHITGMFCLEMGEAEINLRLLSKHTKIPYHKLYIGDIEDLPQIKKVAEELMSLPLCTISTKEDTLKKIRSICYRFKQMGGVVLGIDHIQLIRCPEAPNNLRESLTYITKTLKAIARELNLSIFCLSQLNRSSMTRETPSTADLRESGSIEQDSDVIMIATPCKEDDTITEFHVLKNRHGRIGVGSLLQEKEFFSFSDIKTPETGSSEGDLHQTPLLF